MCPRCSDAASAPCSGLNPISGDGSGNASISSAKCMAIADAGFRTRPPVNTLLDAVSTLLAYSVAPRDAHGLAAECGKKLGWRCGGDADGGGADAVRQHQGVGVDECAAGVDERAAQAAPVPLFPSRMC